MALIEILQYYVLFCLTTSFAGLFIFYRPILNSACECEIENSLTRAPILSQGVFVIVSTLVAPAIFLAIIFPEIHRVFYESMESVVFDED